MLTQNDTDPASPQNISDALSNINQAENMIKELVYSGYRNLAFAQEAMNALQNLRGPLENYSPDQVPAVSYIELVNSEIGNLKERFSNSGA